MKTKPVFESREWCEEHIIEKKHCPCGQAKKRGVVSVKQSPMNLARWCLDLDCTHEAWVTSKTKPTRKTIRCGKCMDAIRALDSQK